MSKQEYHVVYSINRKTLCEEVNRHIQDGWKLQGGICKNHQGIAEFYQALKRNKKSKIEKKEVSE